MAAWLTRGQGDLAGSADAVEVLAALEIVGTGGAGGQIVRHGAADPLGANPHWKATFVELAACGPQGLGRFALPATRSPAYAIAIGTLNR